MKMTDESAWLQKYVRDGCESSFSRLVDRHVAHVYTTALRRVAGERALAEDISQRVFVDLAQKASSLPSGVVLAGWLYRHTCFLAGRAVRSEVRRRRRESTAAEMNQLGQDASDAWQEVEPVLDELLEDLSEKDRNAVFLRFFEKLDLRSVGDRLGISEDAAQKRVSRALVRLRDLFHRRGVAAGLTAAILGDALAGNAAAAAPPSVVAGCKSAALATAASGGGASIIQLTYVMTKTKIAYAAAGALAAAMVAIPLAQNKEGELRNEIGRLEQSLAGLQTRSESTNKPRVTIEPASAPEDESTAREAGSGIPSVTQIVESLRTMPPDGYRTASQRMRFESMLAGLDPSQIEPALEIASAITDLNQRRRVISALLNRWVEIDGAAALAYAKGLGGALHFSRVNSLASRWAALNPAAALAWHKQRQPSESAKEEAELAASLAYGAAHGSFDMAIDFAMSLPDANARRSALGRVSRFARDDQRVARLTAALDQFEDPDDRTRVLANFASGWAASDPKAAAAWVETIEGRERHLIASSVFSHWIYYDPEAAADFYARNGEPRGAVPRIVLSWAERDPVAVGEWLTRQPKESVNDAARGAFAGIIAESDPETALKWANTISDAKARANAFEEIAFYYITGDMSAAERFIEKSGWPARRIAELRQAGLVSETK